MSQPIRIPPRSTVPASSSSSSNNPFHPSYPYDYPQSLPAQHAPASSLPFDNVFVSHRLHHPHHFPSATHTNQTPANTSALFGTTHTADTVNPSSGYAVHHLITAPHFAFGDLDDMDPLESTSPEDVLTSSQASNHAGLPSAPSDGHLNGELQDEQEQELEPRSDLRGALPSTPRHPQTTSADGDLDNEPFIPPHIISDRLYAQQMSRSLNPKKIPKLSLSFLL